MHLHLPKPLHGWRELAGEIAIIVVGVLIALGAEQVVEAAHWRNEVAEARTTLNAQLTGSLAASEERIQMSDCAAQKLDWLDKAIDEDQPQIHKFEIGPIRLWATSAWDAAVSSGAVAHMAAARRNGYANLFAFTAVMRDLNMTELQTTADLNSVTRHRDLTDVSRDRLAQEISRLRSLNSLMTLGAHQWIDYAKDLNITLSADDQKELARPYKCVMPDQEVTG